MPDKDINIHIRGQDTEQTKRDVESVGESIGRLGVKTSEANKQTAEGTAKAAEGMSFLGSQIAKVGNYLLGIFGGVAAINAVTNAIRQQSEAMKEHAEIALKQQNQLLRLQFLGDYYRERPDLRKQVMAYAEAGRRPFEDVAGAMYDLRNLGAGLSARQQQDILSESLELGRTMPQTPLNKIVQSMVFYAKQTGEKNIGRIQNIIRQTLAEAGGEPGEAAADLSKFLPLGISAGMTGPEAAGAWAYTTSQFPEAGRATTALSGIIMALQGKGTPESKRLLRRLGIAPGAPFLQQLQQLSQKQLDLKQIETLASTKEAPVLAALLQNPEAMMKTIGGITAAGVSPEDLTAKSIQGLYGADELARLEDTSRFLGISIENVKAMDTTAVKREIGKKLQDLTYRKRTDSELLIRLWKIMSWFPDVVMGMRRWDVEAGKMQTEPNQPVIINNNYDSSINYHPAVGETESNRFDPNSM